MKLTVASSISKQRFSQGLQFCTLLLYHSLLGLIYIDYYLCTDTWYTDMYQKGKEEEEEDKEGRGRKKWRMRRQWSKGKEEEEDETVEEQEEEGGRGREKRRQF